MKKDIHPDYYPNATVVCACGNTWTVGSTSPEIRTDVCSKCHPFFTGEQRIVDSGGQVERFRRRLAKAVQTQQEPTEKEAPAAEEKEKQAQPTPGSRMRERGKSEGA